MDNEALIIECKFQASTPVVWKALTDKNEMKQWYFSLQDFIPEVGFEFSFLSGPDEEHKYMHLCKVTKVIPEKVLAYSWRYEGYEGDTLVTFELFEEGTATKLRLKHEGLESFPTNNPDFAAESFLEGWTWIIRTSLRDYLDKQNII